MMGRMQRRKQDKNYKYKVKENEKLFTIGTFIKVVIGCTIFVLVFYFILALFVTKEVKVFSGDNKTEESSSNDSNDSVSNKILASNIFDQREESYYVYFYDFNSEDEKLASVVANVSDTVYRVNTNDGFNRNYVSDSDKGNSGAKQLGDLKVINPTLIKVSNDTITEYYEGVSDILNHLNK